MGWDYARRAEPRSWTVPVRDAGALMGLVVERDEAGRISLELHYRTRLLPQPLSASVAAELGRALLEAAEVDATGPTGKAGA